MWVFACAIYIHIAPSWILSIVKCMQQKRVEATCILHSMLMVRTHKRVAKKANFVCNDTNDVLELYTDCVTVPSTKHTTNIFLLKSTNRLVNSLSDMLQYTISMLSINPTQHCTSKSIIVITYLGPLGPQVLPDYQVEGKLINNMNIYYFNKAFKSQIHRILC